MIVSVEVKKGQKPTIDQINEIKAASMREYTADDEAPELSVNQLKQFKTAAEKRHNKNQITLTLSDEEMKTAKGFGANYREILGRLLALAMKDQEILGKIQL